MLGVIEDRDLSLQVTILNFDDPELPYMMRNKQVGKCPEGEIAQTK